MPTSEIVSLILQGGAAAVLIFWVWDLREQRKQERAERIANAEILRTVSQALGDLTDSIESLLEGRQPRPPRTRR